MGDGFGEQEAGRQRWEKSANMLMFPLPQSWKILTSGFQFISPALTGVK